MSPLVALALFAQACFIQSVLSQQSCGFPQVYNPSLSGLNSLNTAPPQSTPVSMKPGYGGVGTGQVGVSGDIGASGQTVVVGSVPVLGSVNFTGTVPAAGSVSISGQCGCGCNA